MLGIKPMKLLVLSFSLPSGLFMDMESKTLLWYWKHALTKAVAGRELSHRLWRIAGDEAFLAGLFQDLAHCCCSSTSASLTRACWIGR